MFRADKSVNRPVFASVLSIMLIVFGLVAFSRLPLREFPDIDPPVVSISVNYPGASASVIETRITQIIEDRIAGVEGVRFINSRSSDGRSNISIEFRVDRDIESAANDVRDRVSGIVDLLPDEADPPEVEKADADDDVILWMNLASDELATPELTDYANRYLVDRFSALDGVAWLLNLRGTDVERTPVALSFVLAHADGTAELFIADEKVTPELRAHLGNAVLDAHGPERQPGIHVAVEADHADRPAIPGARALLMRLDEAHGPELRRTGDGDGPGGAAQRQQQKRKQA